jgi:hypothetical protein
VYFGDGILTPLDPAHCSCCSCLQFTEVTMSMRLTHNLCQFCGITGLTSFLTVCFKATFNCQSTYRIAAHNLDLVKRSHPASEGDTHDGSTPSVKMTRPFKTFGPSSCFMTRHLLYLTPPGCLAAYGYLSDT